MDQDLNKDALRENESVTKVSTNKTKRGKKIGKISVALNPNIAMRGINCGEKSNKCNQREYSSSYANALRAHLKTHSGEKLNKCNQCGNVSS